MRSTASRITQGWRAVESSSSFIAHVLMTVGTNASMALIGMITGILSARLLGPEGRGELAAIQIWPLFIGTVAMLGTPDALVYYSAKNPAKAGSYLSSALLISLVSSVAFGLTGYLTLPIVMSRQSAAVITAARRFLWIIPIFALSTAYHPLRGLNKFHVWNVLRMIPNVLWLAILIAGWVLKRHEPQLLTFLYLAALAAVFPVVWYVVLRLVRPSYRPDIRKCRELLRYGMPCVAASVPQLLNFRLDQMIMAAFMPTYDLGLYAVAVAWSSAAQPILAAAGSVLFPRVATAGDQEARVRVFALGIRLGSFASVLLGCAVALVTPWMVPALFGRSFDAAIPIALVLIAAAALTGINGIVEESLRGFGSPTAVMWAEVAGAVVTAITLVPLLLRFQTMGAALASLLGYSAVLFVALYKAMILSGCPFRSLLYPTYEDFAFAATQMKAISTKLGLG